MTTRLGKVGLRTLAGAVVVSGPVAAACSTGPTYEQWAATDGAAGRINLEDVQEAFKSSKSATDFEQRVNQIYEGDRLLLVRAKQEGNSTILEGWEDLNSDNEITDTQDDLLFSITREGDNNEMRGHGANGYYRNSFGGGGFLFGYLIASSLAPRGYYYQTSQPYARTTLRRQRDSYRNTSRYRSQVSRNSGYFNRKGGFSASSYNNAGRNVGTSRQRYLSNQKSTGTFKNSRTGVRSSWGSSGRGGGFGRGGAGGRGGGIRGFGGSQVIVGNTRW